LVAILQIIVPQKIIFFGYIYVYIHGMDIKQRIVFVRKLKKQLKWKCC